MSGSQQNYSQIHAEVEDLEDLGFGQGKNQDATKFRESDSTEHRAAHMCQRFLCPLHPRALDADGESSHNVTAELH